MSAKTPILLTLVLIWSGGLVRTADAGQPERGPVQVFILAGQSNMEGHGKISGRDGQADKGTLKHMVTDKTPLAFKEVQPL